MSWFPGDGLVHSLSGSDSEMEQWAELWLGISVNGISFRIDDQLDMVRHVPLNRCRKGTPHGAKC
ncbi:hypothetical protein BDQ94DRAFT_155020 [Aspergillus welwitschiae]|uniref:Uncharacterized protein n=1 Tax=Aspergillus welwitschiae TaxID=1341132 RepID=A0A3F3PK59_9EURO|nr:hypothetical protein BDQ94DRAFT_155020 [Aspergillus welwitschiae]RDH26746.1 hypothetical protein BDQ94DRAFT_155020 [Aspergillus welwitschiae]